MADATGPGTTPRETLVYRIKQTLWNWPGFQSYFCLLLSVEHWAHYLTFMFFSMLICKIKTIEVTNSSVMRIKWDNYITKILY